MTTDIDHVGFALDDAAAGLQSLRNSGYFSPAAGEEDNGFRWVIGSLDSQGQGIRVELLDPNDDPNSPIAKHLCSHEAGAQHITFLVDNLRDTDQKLKRHRINLSQLSTDESAWQEGFIHPRHGMGVVIQIAATPLSYDATDPALRPHRNSATNKSWWEKESGWDSSPRTPLALKDIVLEVENLQIAHAIFALTLGAIETARSDSSTTYAWPSGAITVRLGTAGITNLTVSAATNLGQQAVEIGQSQLVKE